VRAGRGKITSVLEVQRTAHVYIDPITGQFKVSRLPGAPALLLSSAKGERFYRYDLFVCLTLYRCFR